MTSNIKYIGLDVHKESISICVRNSVGKVVRFAKQFFGNQDPIGKRVNLAILNQSAEIVGTKTKDDTTALKLSIISHNPSRRTVSFDLAFTSPGARHHSTGAARSFP